MKDEYDQNDHIINNTGTEYYQNDHEVWINYIGGEFLTEALA